MTEHSPETTQPSRTRDGVDVTPLAGGFLSPYSERLGLIAHLSAPSAQDMEAAMAAPAAPEASEPSEPAGTRGEAAGAPFSGEAMASMEAWSAPFGVAEQSRATTQDLEVPGPHGQVPVRVYRPEPGWQPPTPSPLSDHEGTALRAGLVWFHGGAFVGGDLDMPEADAVARGITTRTGSTVVSVFYRLCNDGVTHHPVPHDDAWAAFRWTSDHAVALGIDPSRLAIGGASAGGNLAAGVALHGRDASCPPWQALLAYPVLHADHWPAPSAELAARLSDMPQVLRFPADVMALMNANYLGAPAREVPGYAFPGEAADLSGYPSTYIESCENDDLRASSEAFARQLLAAGADVEALTAAGVPHGHLNAVGSPLTSQSLDRFAARLARQP